MTTADCACADLRQAWSSATRQTKAEAERQHGRFLTHLSDSMNETKPGVLTAVRTSWCSNVQSPSLCGDQNLGSKRFSTTGETRSQT